MPLIIVGIGILVLLLLIGRFKINAFFALLITSFVVGLLNGMNLLDILDSILKGVGDTLGKIVLILVFGAMLGKLVEESGAAHTITHQLTALMGIKNIQYALLLTGFLVGLPMLYNASFLVMIPLIYTFASTTKLPLLYLGLPMCATLSVAHGFLPPHPAPTYVSFIYEANVNKVLLYGLIPVIPACFLGGIVLSKFFRNSTVKPPEGLYQERHFKEDELPGLGISIITAATPVILMLLGAIIDISFGPPPARTELSKLGFENLTAFYQQLFVHNGFNESSSSIISHLFTFVKFLSDANIALFMAVVVGIVMLGLRRGKSMDELMKSMGNSIGPISMIILIIAAGGAFSQVLKDSHVNEYIKTIAGGIHINPLLLAFSIAAIFRLAVGSATVATLTTAPIMLPIAQQTGISPELMVIATGSGSIMWSHFNDIGFWMFKEYFNLSIKQTFLSWTVMECIVGITGITTVMIINIFM